MCQPSKDFSLPQVFHTYHHTSRVPCSAYAGAALLYSHPRTAQQLRGPKTLNSPKGCLGPNQRAINKGVGGSNGIPFWSLSKYTRIAPKPCSNSYFERIIGTMAGHLPLQSSSWPLRRSHASFRDKGPSNLLGLLVDEDSPRKATAQGASLVGSAMEIPRCPEGFG